MPRVESIRLTADGGYQKIDIHCRKTDGGRVRVIQIGRDVDGVRSSGELREQFLGKNFRSTDALDRVVNNR